MAVHQLRQKPAAERKAVGYRMVARGSTGEIYLYGIVGDSFFGDGVTAKNFADDLTALGNITNITLRINSEGGDVFQGRTIYTLLKQHKATVTVYVDGLAASIASLIAMAGDEIIMGEGSFMMIHNPWTFVAGDSNEMRRMADLMDTIRDTMVDSYATRSGLKASEIIPLLDAETWMKAEDAVQRGFADKVAAPVRVAASITLPKAFKNLPAALRPNRSKLSAAIERASALKKS